MSFSGVDWYPWRSMVDMVVPCKSVIDDYAKALVLLDLLNSVSIKFDMRAEMDFHQIECTCMHLVFSRFSRNPLFAIHSLAEVRALVKVVEMSSTERLATNKVVSSAMKQLSPHEGGLEDC